MKRLLEISWDKRAIFLERPNRFLGLCRELDGAGRQLEVHVRDPGRLRELLFEGNEVLLKKAARKRRKTGYDLVAARSSGSRWVLVNSGFHSQIASMIFRDQRISPFGPVHYIKPEVKAGKSRLDFFLGLEAGREMYVEVKGCTLEKKGVAFFPDAPTERGRRHLLELMDATKQGFGAAVVFLIFCPLAYCFEANIHTDPKFHRCLYMAMEQGVEVHPLHLEYKDRFIWYKREIEICSRTEQFDRR